MNIYHPAKQTYHMSSLSNNIIYNLKNWKSWQKTFIKSAQAKQCFLTAFSS